MKKAVNASQDTPGSGKDQLRQNLLTRPEGHILMGGIGLLFVCVVWAGISWLWSPEYCKKLISLAVTRLVVGRPGGVYFGHVLEFGYGTNVSVNMLVDVIAVFLLYPLFVFSIENIFVFRSLKNFIEHIHKTAQVNYKIIRAYGIPGLFLFVLFPLWGTGPVVGSVIGFMMGLQPRLNMGVVLGATFMAVVLWAVILAEFHVRLLAHSASMPIVVAVMLFVFAVGLHIGRGLRHKD